MSASFPRRPFLHSRWALPLIMVLLVIVRIWLGNLRPVTYTNNGFFDEYRLLKMADLNYAFHTTDFTALNKTLAFSWFLDLASKLPFSLDTFLALYWSMAALIVWWLLKVASASRKWAFFGFIVVLFCPSAFEDQAGIRLYRNILLAPAIYIFLALLGILFLSCWKKKPAFKSLFLASFLLALTFPFSYYLKEDGLWMLLSLIVFALLCAGGLLWNTRLRWQKRLPACLIGLLALLLPFLSFSWKTSEYLAANEKYYQYPAITLRTGGEFYKFIQNVYKIESKDRSMIYWAPKDAFRQVMAVSPTLAKMDKFTSRLLNDSWITHYGDIQGDFLGWTMLIAFHETGTYTSPKELNDTFAAINAEIDQAFQEGKLKKDTRFQLTSQTGGRTWSEIQLLFPDMARLYSTAIFLNGYTASLKPVDTTGAPPLFTEEQTRELLKTWSEKLKTDLEPPKDEKAMEGWTQSRTPGLILSWIDFFLYRLINPILILAGGLLWVFWLFLVLVKKSHTRLLSKVVSWLIFLLGGMGICYAAALVWFSQFIYLPIPDPAVGLEWLVYYGPGMFPMLTIPALLAFSLYRPFSRRSSR